MKKKKIAIIGTVGLPANYGGFETMVNYLTINKSDEFEFTVYCQKTPRNLQIKEYNGSKLFYLPFKANGVQSIIYDIIAITKSWFKYDSLLILGTPGCIVLPILKVFKNTRTVINFGGLEWKREKWGRLVNWYLKVTEGIAVKYSTTMVADNNYFCEYIKETYNEDSVLIEYGGDHTSKFPLTDEMIAKYPFLELDYDISVSRAQADNNLHVLLEAYSKVPERNLVLVSNYNKFDYGRQLKEKYSKFPNLYLQDAVYNLDELDTIRSNAQLYIHSHSFCGTAPSLVEAMNLGLPIVAFDVPTNHYTTENKALYFNNSEDLIKIIANLTHEKSASLSIDMLKIAKKRYTWKRISSEYIKILDPKITNQLAKTITNERVVESILPEKQFPTKSKLKKPAEVDI